MALSDEFIEVLGVATPADSSATTSGDSAAATAGDSSITAQRAVTIADQTASEAGFCVDVAGGLGPPIHAPEINDGFLSTRGPGPRWMFLTLSKTKKENADEYQRNK